MVWNSHFIVRRTDSQERFAALWVKRKNGELTLKELTEMDDIINRDPLVMQFVLEEMQNQTSMPGDDNGHDILPLIKPPRQTFIDKLKSFFSRIVSFLTTDTKPIVTY